MLAAAFPTVGVTIFYLFLGVTCAYAFWRGGGPERSVAAMLLTAAILSDLAYSSAFSDVELTVWVIDAVLLAGLALVMISARRLWPIFMVGMHVLSVFGHGARFENSELLGAAYAVVAQAWSYPMQLTLVLGTYLHHRRLKRHGVDRSWLRFWNLWSAKRGRLPTD